MRLRIKDSEKFERIETMMHCIVESIAKLDSGGMQKNENIENEVKQLGKNNLDII